MWNDDIRGPSSQPSDEERGLMAFDFGGAVIRSFVFALVAACIGLGASALVQPGAPATVAATQPAPN